MASAASARRAGEEPLAPRREDVARALAGGAEHATEVLKGMGSIFLYGDSVCEELGSVFFSQERIEYVYPYHDNMRKMRGSTPDDISQQVFVAPSCFGVAELRCDVQQKLSRAALIVLSAGKNVMDWMTMRQIADEIRALVLPMLAVKPAGLPMLLITPTKTQHVHEEDAIAETLRDLESGTFQLVRRSDVGLTADDFRPNDPMHLTQVGMAKLTQARGRALGTSPPACLPACLRSPSCLPACLPARLPAYLRC